MAASSYRRVIGMKEEKEDMVHREENRGLRVGIYYLKGKQ